MSAFLPAGALLPRRGRRPARCRRRAPRSCDTAGAGAAAGAEGGEYALAAGEVAVVFTKGGADAEAVAVAAAREGANLLTVGDGVGVRIPRACRTGLCGSCTVDVCVGGGAMETVRACQTRVAAGGMTVDVGRMRAAGRGRDAMRRFENMDTEYVAGAAPRRRGRAAVGGVCAECAGEGRGECYACEGGDMRCGVCVGTGWVRCAECQGAGVVG